MTTSCWPSSQSRSAAQKPADPVPTTTVFAVTTGTSRPPIVTDSGSGLGIVCSVVSSQGGDVHAAVDVEPLPGGVRRLPRGEHGERTGHIGRQAPPPDRREALGEQGVVLPGDGRCHVGGDDAGPDLVHDDPLGGEPDREELRGHAHPRLGHAVLTTVGGEYCVSKAGVGMATQLFAVRLAPEGIVVYEVRPGVVATDMTAAVTGKYDTLFAEGLAPIRRWGRPADVAGAVSMLASGQTPYSTGEVFHVDGGMHIPTL